MFIMMREYPDSPSLASSGHTDQNQGGNFFPPSTLWTAGVSYPNGTRIWCAYRAGEAAWTMDRKLAARYSSESTAAMAARNLTEGEAVPFWTMDEK